jgi:uncharacterized protein YfiM (DUF2279 family)
MLIPLYLACIASISYAQSDTSRSGHVNPKRLAIVVGSNAIFYTGSYIVLNKAWYSDYEKTSFHFFNDNPEWNQMDKAGHVWSTYHVSRFSTNMWRWTGMSRSHSALAGALSGMAYQTIIEMQDAYSAAWGFSWGDVAANVAGAGLFLTQDLTWADQRILVKMGYHPFNYPASLKHRRDELFGSSTAEQILKDYNSQTYWLSANLRSFFPESGIPRWLNLAVGYSADGMYGGRVNTWTDDEGRMFDYGSVPRRRKIYLSPDIDLTIIKTKSRALKTVFYVANAIRIPLPAIEFAGKNAALKVR